MSGMKSTATLIGDVVGSRTQSGRRAALHAALERALATVNERMSPSVPLRITVGDEYQGCFASVGDACRAALLLRLMLRPDHDVRHGLGWGETTVLGDVPRIEDGPGWWAARAAVEAVEADASRAALREARTAYRLAENTTGPEEAAINAALLCRDHLVGELSGRSVMLLRGLLDGRTQAEIAAEIGVSASALSQRVRRDGIGVVLRSDELLGKVG